ncbi:MAG TPA: AMP-binding protein [Caulobacteraceae bacterium]|nr:AMP-binding protein [Caulobacteraceae bacterium]
MEHPDLIHARFEAQARSAPDALAICSDQGSISYGELERLSARLGAQIEATGCRPGELVAILAERGPRLVVAALACARAGRPFVVLDLAYPPARLAELARICRPKLLLKAGDEARTRACGFETPALAVDLDCGAAAAPARTAASSPDAVAYLLFTSGSTGLPKCVACSHRPLVHFVDWQARTFGLTRRDRFTLLSGLSHDPVLRDIFTPLSLGASLHIPAQDVLTAPGGLHAWFLEARPTAAHMTPPLGHLLTAVRGRPAPLAELRYVFWGGDVLRRPLVEAVGRMAPACESVNFYGATETPQAASCFRVPPGCADDRAPIGTGIDGFSLEIRDEAGAPAAAGEPGEIVVRSAFLSLGQVRDGRPPTAAEAQSCYATGDLGYLRPDGQACILGRRDDQVKVRGHRLELAQLTACALAAANVAQAITLDLGAPDAVRLACFVQPRDPGAGLETEALRRHFETRLPAYALPDALVVVDALPLLPNGKIDRQALIERGSRAPAPSPPAAATPAMAGASVAAAALVDGWRDIFGREQVDAASSFASLGGDSLSYVNAYLCLEEALGSVPERWTTMTIAELAAGAPAERKRGFLVDVESAILMRALAIAAVVASHFQLLFTGGAATGALIWVSGALFGNLQLHEVDHQANLKPIGRLLKSILIPLFAVEAPQVLVKFALHYHARLSSVFLYTDLLDYTGLPNSGPNAYGGHEFLMWYIHCLLHIILIFAALIFVFSKILKVRRPVMTALIAAVGLGLAGRFVLPALVVPHFWSQPVNPMSVFNHSPATYLATFALAALSGFTGRKHRLALMAATLAYAGLSAPIYGVGDSVALAAVAALLLFVPKTRLPRPLSLPVHMLAGASFFIYLLHLKFLWLAHHFPGIPVIAIWAAAMAGGVAAWSAWNWGTRRLGAATAWARRAASAANLGLARAAPVGGG